jgi:hypothetical protein
MAGPLIAIVGDASPDRKFDPAMKSPVKAKKAAEELGTELARRGARLLVCGGPFLEAEGYFPRDNVVLEAGLFMSRLTQDRVAYIVEQGALTATDLLGLHHYTLEKGGQTKQITNQQKTRLNIIANDLANV